MEKFNFVSVDTIFSKLYRDLRGLEVEETDIIEWIGEALAFVRAPSINEEAVAFIEVADNVADIPTGLKIILQVARNNSYVAPTDELSPASVLSELTDDTPQDGIELTNDLGLPDEFNIAYYRPYYDLKYEYEGWIASNYYKGSYSPVRLSNNTFFKSIVAMETDPELKRIYTSSTDEYTLIGTYPNNKLLFNFTTGYVAVSYIRAKVDENTGYPLIPDDISFISAITYYVKWKLAERMRWFGIDGGEREAKYAEQAWLKYIRQANNRAKMLETIDDYQDVMEQSLHLIPRTRLYNGFFGNLGREELRRFNNPDGRRRFTYNRYNYGFRY